ncbi:MAG TPA: HAD family phosphatase [Panacibacter sp.]|nr:HAD family phosphatase [Panacibacter sp.]HNP46274.1 HAD family phosphatase [Panacibacter sp.]
MQQVKNIIFDLGGIFLDIDFSKTFNAFSQLGYPHFYELYTQHHASDLFIQLETGAITPGQFCALFRQDSGTDLSNDQIFFAWNALLGGFPPARIQWLDAIRKKYQVYLFSNTNKIHHAVFSETFRRSNNGTEFDSYFIKSYYSHEMGMRKPDPGSFLYIINELGIDPAETVFIDDTFKNIEGAQVAGLQTIFLPPPKTVLDTDL